MSVKRVLSTVLLAAAMLVRAPAVAAEASATATGRAVPRGVHPAVARIITPLRGAMAFGSGTLVAVNQTQGLVLTNWHVVEDAAGPIRVQFPDGFSSPARVLKGDRNWDLAALLIHRPNVEPVTLAQRAPRPGEPLSIAGYGSGNYRSAGGRCTQYVAPAEGFPFEMVELAATARQGDSGGPIFNSQGELAGVLFGTGGGSTTGSYCGRVKWFLASITGPADKPESTAIAKRPAPAPGGPQSPSPEAAPPMDVAAWRAADPPLLSAAEKPVRSTEPPPSPIARPSENKIAAAPRPSREQPRLSPPRASSPGPTPGGLESAATISRPSAGAASAAQPPPPLASLPGLQPRTMESGMTGLRPSAGAANGSQPVAAPPAVVAPATPSGSSQPSASGGPFEDIKTFLAAAGLVAILFHSMRLLSLAQSPPPKRRRSKAGS